MPAKLFWTPKARADVKKIFVDIAMEQPRSAERYFAKIRNKTEMLIEHPRLGERHPEVFRTARMLVEAPYTDGAIFPLCSKGKKQALSKP